jgi:hypothetical protein
MSEYTLVIRIPQAGNKEISYSINLNGLHESYPEDYFRQETPRFNISQTIEKQSARKIDAANLSVIIANWISDIKLGRHRTIVTLDLPLDATIGLESVVTPNQTIAAPAKQPSKQPLTPPSSVVKPAKTPNTVIQNTTKINPAETPVETPVETQKKSSPDIRTDSNKADF